MKDYAGTIAGNAPLTVGSVKFIVGEALKDETKRDNAAMAASVTRCFASKDYVEGRTAFMEKRKPVFTGHPEPCSARVAKARGRSAISCPPQKDLFVIRISGRRTGSHFAWKCSFGEEDPCTPICSFISTANGSTAARARPKK